MITIRWLCAATLFLAVAAMPQRLSAAQAAADVEQGKKLFQGMCVTCHGFEGAGGDAPSLNRPKLDRAPDDDALRAVIADGLPDRGMPRVRRLTNNELRQLVGYVRSLGRTASLPLSANPQKGGEIYRGLGCASCHIINGQGGSLGPELTSIGRLRGVEYLRQGIVDPELDMSPRQSAAPPGTYRTLDRSRSRDGDQDASLATAWLRTYRPRRRRHIKMKTAFALTIPAASSQGPGQ